MSAKPASKPLNAEEVEAQVVRRLGIGRVRGLRVTTGEHGLVLWGRTSTYYAKQLAQSAVMEVTAMPIAANQIEVA